jgi:hypothetical protein
MNIAENVVLVEGRPVLYLLLGARGLNAQTLLEQMTCSHAGVDWVDFAEEKLGPDDRKRVAATKQKLERSPLAIDDTPHLKDVEIAQRIETWANDFPGGVVIVDDFEQRNTGVEVDRCSHAVKSAAAKTKTAILGTAIYAPLSDYQCSVYGVGLSHADFSWSLLRRWCWSSIYPPDEFDLSIVDRRTSKQRLKLELQLEETLRRFRVVGSLPCTPSLRESRLQRPDASVYHRVLKPDEKPPAGAKLIYMRGVRFDPGIELWEAPNGDA